MGEPRAAGTLGFRLMVHMLTYFGFMSEMTLSYWMVVERDSNLKEEVGSSIPGNEISSLLDITSYKVVNCLMCFGIGLSAFCLKKKNILQIFYIDLRYTI